MEILKDPKSAGSIAKRNGSNPFFSPKPVQAKLEVNFPGDVYEVEADQVAERVLEKISDSNTTENSVKQKASSTSESINQSGISNPLPTSPSKNAAPNHIQTKCEDCEAEEMLGEEEVQRKVDYGISLHAAGTDDEDPSLMTKRSSTLLPTVSQETTAQLFASKGGGNPLQKNTRAEMERGFGVDFSGVRIHDGPSAAKMSKNLGAQAFTHGSDIYFNQGKFDTQSKEGKRLLAHELTHVVQQGGGSYQINRQEVRSDLDQCIAELGGDTRYRDGGIASVEELDRYREECLRRGQAPGLSRAIENLGRAWNYARERLGDEVRAEVEHLFSRESLAMMAAFLVVFLAAQLTPVGWIADAFALTALTLTVVFVGALAISIIRDLFTFFSAINATSEEEIQVSGNALARALARGGVGIFIALLSRGMRIPGRPGSPPPATSVEVLAVNFGRVRVSAATLGEAVETSRLQSLASYAVMVPPPGGTGPSAPSSDSQSSAGPRTPETTARPGASGGFNLSRIGYGEGPLSPLAQRFRLLRGMRRGGNVAVFEFESIPPAFRRLVLRLGGRNVLVEGNRIVFQNVGGSAHSEVLAHELISTGRRAGLDLRISRIYTEYNPCTDTCLPLIRRNYPNAEVSYSYIWERWGRETPERDAAVDLLFGNSGTP